jgi:site-specific DNA recombinase
MTGYLNLKKQLHYYKCQSCKNSSINAKSSKYGIGANELFIKLLQSYELSAEMINLYKSEALKILNDVSINQDNTISQYKTV